MEKKKKLLEEFYVIRNVREEIPIGIREKLIGVRKTKRWSAGAFEERVYKRDKRLG